MLKSLLIATLMTAATTAGGEYTPYSSSNYYNPKVIAPKSAKCPQWWDMAQSIGWRKNQLEMMDKIMYRESRCDLYAVNKQDPNGGSFGLMQVNGFWDDFCNLNKKRDLIDPSINLRCSLSIFNYAKSRYDNGWGPWNEQE